MERQKAGGLHREPPLFSVVVPVYQAERYLTRCAESILAQTFGDFELLLVDDGSPDGSGAICDALAEKDWRVRVFHKANEGEAKTREFGAVRARGQILVWVDADDWIEADLLGEIAAVWRDTGADIILYGWRELVGDRVVREERFGRRTTEEWRRAMVTGKTGYLWSYASRRTLWGGEHPFGTEPRCLRRLYQEAPVQPGGAHRGPAGDLLQLPAGQ